MGETEFATVEKLGGNKNLQAHTHANTVTASQTSHRHSLLSQDNWTGNCVGLKHSNKHFAIASLDGNEGYNNGYCNYNVRGNYWVGDTQPKITATIVNASTGTGNSQNLQPYITCYMWKRTA